MAEGAKTRRAKTAASKGGKHCFLFLPFQTLTSLDPTYGLVRALRPARLLEVEHAALASHVTSCRLLFVVLLFVSLGTLECWGGRQGGYGLELCVRQLRVCGSQLAVCLVSLLCLCVARACRHHLSSVHPYRVGVQSEPGCSSPFYLPT